MRSSPDKCSLAALPSRIRDSRSAARRGFTLLELLVAVAMITIILSMVYGSYFATSRSAEACEARINLSQDARKVLEQIARQIRCSYAPASAHGTDAVSSSTQPSTLSRSGDGLLSGKSEFMPKDTICYFHGSQDGSSGEFLHLVTTHPVSWQGDSKSGLFDVTYKFDRMRGQLSFSQERFIGTSEDLVQARNWQPILTNVESIELTFFDGQRWLHEWDYKEKRRLPCAVRIGIACVSDGCQRAYCTAAHIFCQTNKGNSTLSDTLVSLNE